VLTLLEYNFLVKYTKGSINKKADAFSRRPNIVLSDKDNNKAVIVLDPSKFQIIVVKQGDNLIEENLDLLKRN
jgi:hypothetical protein